MNLIKKIIVFVLAYLTISSTAIADLGFVDLPMISDKSAYVSCNDSGDYGRLQASIPSLTEQNRCAITSEALNKSPLSSPLEGFRLVGVQVSDVEMESSKSGPDAAVAILSEAIWRNSEKTECILATQLEMRDAALADGSYFEINDIAHAGFAKKNSAIAYFHKNHSTDPGGNTEVLFRAGRTFTSVVARRVENGLPTKINAPVSQSAFSTTGAAAYSDNWINFTTDVSFKDSDGTTRAHSSIFYIKYSCDSRDPVAAPKAIRLRTTNDKKQYELAVPGLIPADGVVDLF